MGKAKRTKKSIGAAARTNPIKIDDPHLKKIHEEKVMPLVQKLKSVNPTERSEALLAIAHLVDDADFRKLLLREYIIQTCLERLLNDDDFTVSVRAWGVLRNIAVEEGHDICLFLYRNDVLVPVKAAIQKLGTLLDGSQKRTKSENELVWDYAENVAGILWCLSEISDEVTQVICKENDVFLFLLHLINPTTAAPPSTQETAAQALYTITIAQPGIPSDVGVALLEIPSAPPVLLRLLNDESVQVPTIVRISAAGTIHNTASDDKSISTDPEVLPRLMKLLEDACTQINSALKPSPEFTSGTKAADLALEVIGSIAIGAQDAVPPEGDMEDDEDEEAEDAGSDEEMADGDDTKMGDDDAEDETEDVIESKLSSHSSDDEDLPDELKNDLDMVVGSDHEDSARPSISLPLVTESLFRQLITTLPTAVFTIVSPTSTYALSTQIRAITALSNLAWTISSSLPPSTPLFRTWRTVALSIWSDIITPLLTTNTADLELADALTALSAGLSKSIPLPTQTQHHSFMALYRASLTPPNPDLLLKSISVLAGLATTPSQIPQNLEIGTFLLSLLPDPATPPEAVIEAANVLMDIYADGDFDYDEPNFVKHGFLKHVEAALPKVRHAVRRVNRATDKELRERGDEVVENLARFVSYKRKEAQKKGKKE